MSHRLLLDPATPAPAVEPGSPTAQQLVQVIKEATVPKADDTREWAVQRLKTLSRLSPWRLLRQFLHSGDPLDIDAYFDEFECAALSVDISGFSTIAERLFDSHGLAGAEELAEHINDVLGDICEQLTAAGGDIIKFAGDACLCVFPANNTLTGEEYAMDLRCQVLMATRLSLRCIAALDEKKYTVEGVTLTAHSGIGVGPVTGFLAGGLFQRSEYTLMGTAIAQLGAAEPLAGQGETVVSSACWQMLEHDCEGQVIDASGQPFTARTPGQRPHGEWFAKVTATPQPSAVPTSRHLAGTAMAYSHASGAAQHWGHSSGVVSVAQQIEALSKEEANMIIEEIKQVVPGQVRQKLTQFTPHSVPNLAEFRMVTVVFTRLLGLDYRRGISELKKVQVPPAHPPA